MALISRRELRAPVEHYKKAVAINEDRNAPFTTEWDVFLSHSYRDAQTLTESELLQLRILLASYNLKVYVDWVVDPNLDHSRVTKENAMVLRHRMDNSRSLLFATTRSSSDSKWMPWELGYIDAKTSRVAILPIMDQSTNGYYGQEYLGMYPHVTRMQSQTGNDLLYVVHDPLHYQELCNWTAGATFTYKSPQPLY